MSKAAARPEKVCPTCGRTFAWRKRWARNWESVVYCSRRCGANKDTSHARSIEARILAHLGALPRGASIDSIEVIEDELRDDVEAREEVRAAARRLAHRAVLDILQGGRRVDPDGARGPLRLRLR